MGTAGCSRRSRRACPAANGSSHPARLPPDMEIKSNRTGCDVFSEVQLLLAEKRTSLSTLRTGIAVFALPLSVLGLLVATSNYYHPRQAMGFLLPLLGLCALLVLLGAYLIIHALRHIRRHNRLIRQIKQDHSAIAEYID